MDDPRVKFQRDFYHLLLRLTSDHLEIEKTLQQALDLIVDSTDAERAYLEVKSTNDQIIHRSIAISDQDLSNIQLAVSSGIIAEAIRSKESILIPSALIDPRFQARESVQRLAIESVLCVPFFGSTTTGVLYLQGDKGFKSSAEKIQLDAELFAQHVSPLFDQMLLEQERNTEPSTISSLREAYSIEGVIGESPTFVECLQSALMVAPLEVTTLILGETGTGKTELARVIHQNSGRQKGKFVEINCAAIPDTLLENELFGAIPGGHSSASIAVTGKITSANGGTLFLDEIGELSLESQAKLLQFIASGTYYRLGSPEVLTADVRLIFATNKDLAEQVRKGNFREDLYFRINTFEMTLPALHHRRTDIALLFEQFVKSCVEKHRFQELKIHQDVLGRLSNATFPGNIRELKNIAEKACISASMKNDPCITLNQIPELSTDIRSATTDFHSATLEFQRELLSSSLIESSWNISKTARHLSLSRSHVHNLINSFGLSRN